MAQNNPEIIEVPTPQSRQVKRKGSDADLHRKRLRTDDSMDIEVVPKENEEKYATKEEFNICMERISKIESRLAKIEKTFESLKSAFLGPNHPSRSVPSSVSSAPGPSRPPPKSSNSASTSVAMPAEGTPSSATNSSKEAPPSVALPAPTTHTSPAMSAQQTPLSSAVKSAQRTPLASAARSIQGTPNSSVSKSAQVTPNSSVSKSAQVTPSASASKSAQVTPNSSASKSAQMTLNSSASKSAHVSPISSASKSAQGTPVSSAAKTAQVTPISSAGISAQVTPISSAGKPAQVTVTPISSTAKSVIQVTPISSAGKSAQVAPISSASKPTQRTPPSGTKSSQGTSNSAQKSFMETAPLGKKSTQGMPSMGNKSVQGPSIGVRQAPSATNSAQSVSSSASNLMHRPVVNSVQRQNVETIDDEVTVIPTDDPGITTVSNSSNANIQISSRSSVSGNTSAKTTNAKDQRNIGLPRINVIPQNELLAVHSDQPTSERNPHSYNQQRAGSLAASNVAPHPRSQQLASTSSSSTSVRAQTSSHEAAQNNINESWASSSASDMNDMPEEVFCHIRPKQEIYDNPESSTIETSTNRQLVAYTDGDCRKKKNHDVYAAVCGYSLNGTKIYCVPYISDLRHPFTQTMPAVRANRKMVELVKQQTEVMAAYLVITNLGGSGNDRLKVVSRCQRLVQIMKGSLDVYPAFNTCQCDRFPCNHPQRWETLDTFAHLLSDDLPRLVLATKGASVNVEWCNYTPFDQEEKKITESLKKEFKKKISELLSRTTRRNAMLM
ncbi:sialidase-like isoform X2 [Thrips palmi]|uniref:Sialidase-like isoform X2 n=1 Tax=Thrips palmi TaxID=161013 RepID=A0A6P9A7U4_THRPL|nr:sialidase-like isoform X2 [Thrips palmi]